MNGLVPFGEAKCDCQLKCFRKDFEEHFNQCSHRPATCEHCKATVKFKDMESHLAVCTLVPFNCEYCNAAISKRSYVQHNKICPDQFVLCSLVNATIDVNHSDGSCCRIGELCNELILRKDLELHRSTDCVFRMVKCEECDLSVASVCVEAHKLEQCLKYIHTCTACGATHTLPESHASLLCPEVEINCPVLHCTHKCLRKFLPVHFTDEGVAQKHIELLCETVKDQKLSCTSKMNRLRNIISKKNERIDYLLGRIEDEDIVCDEYNREDDDVSDMEDAN